MKQVLSICLWGAYALFILCFTTFGIQLIRLYPLGDRLVYRGNWMEDGRVAPWGILSLIFLAVAVFSGFLMVVCDEREHRRKVKIIRYIP